MRERGRGRCGSPAWTLAALVLAGALGGATDGGAQQRTDEAAQPPPELIVLPPDADVKLRPGERQPFSVSVTASGATFRWQLDGAAVGDGTGWTYRPEPADLGTHEVTVTVLVGSTATRRRWQVTVTPAPPPTVRDVAPAGEVLRGETGTTVSFRFMVDPGVPTDTIAVTWTVDGEEAGTGTHLRVEPPATGHRRIRAVASSDLGAIVVRQWELHAPASAPQVASEEPPLGAVPPDEELLALLESPPERTEAPAVAPPTTAPPVAPPTTAPPVAPSSTVPPVATTSTQPRAVATTTSAPARVAVVTTSSAPARLAVVTTSTAPRRPAPTTSTSPPRVALAPPSTAPPAERARPVEAATAVAALPPGLEPIPPARSPSAASGITRADVDELMGRYERAFSRHDVEELRRIGQVADDQQADALGRYFESVSDLQVSVRVLSVEARGDVATVRFQRRDRFRDPTGRVVDKESPPIEKVLRRTPGGLRFVPRS